MKILQKILLLIVLLIIPQLSVAQTNTITHVVGRGETITSIAKKYGVSEEEIKELNPKAGKFIYVGMDLKISVKPNVRESDSNVTKKMENSTIFKGSTPKKSNIVSKPEIIQRTTKNITSTFSNLAETPLLQFGGYGRKSFSMYLALQGNVGFSNFHSPDVNCNGKFSYGGELQFQLYDKGGLLFDGYYLQAGIGYQSIGAADFDMNYIQIRLLPLGYAYNIDEEKSAMVKAGIYFGLPLNDLESSRNTFVSKKDFGLDLGVAFDYNLITLGATLQYGFGNICESDNKLKNVGISGSITYKFGKF